MALTSGSKILVSDISTALNGKLSLAGGAMTDAIIRRNVDNMYISICGGSGNPTNYTSGSVLAWGKDHVNYPGYSALWAADGTNSAKLMLSPAGQCTVAGKNVVRSINNIEATDAGNVSLDVGTVVTQVGSFTGTSGKSDSPVTKTITGLTKYKPLYIMVRQNSSKTSGVYCHITSGITVVDGSSSNLMATRYSSIWMAVIPISTSVTLNFSSSSSSEGVAYQAFAWQ